MEFVDKRLEVCKACPLYKETAFGAVCNPKLYINADGETSYISKEGYKKGCNCILRRKAANPGNHCIVGKW